MADNQNITKYLMENFEQIQIQFIKEKEKNVNLTKNNIDLVKNKELLLNQ